MIRAFAVVAALAAGAAAWWWLLPPAPLPARFAAEECRRQPLTDPETGWRISGAEDLAAMPDGQTLILAAHDRRDRTRPDGGLYALDLDALRAAGPVVPTPLVERGTRATPFRPHGLALSPAGDRLAVVNRRAPGEAVVEIGPLGPGGWRAERVVEDPRLCRANDVEFTGGDALLVSLDRASCGTALRDLWPWSASGSVARLDDRLSVTAAGLAFPNGIAWPYVAETRAGRLWRADGEAVALPGAPDNLNRAGDAVIAAVHPSLTRLWLYLSGWRDSAPSRIVRVEPGSGAIEVLFDDPAGRIFAAATSAVLAGDMLVAGSVGDSGLFVCGAGR